MKQIPLYETKLCEGLVRLVYVFKYWLSPGGEQFEAPVRRESATEWRGKVPNAGELSMKINPGSGMTAIDCEFICTAAEGTTIGFYFVGLEFPDEAEAWRILPGVYSGFTRGGETWKFTSIYCRESGIRQMANAIDSTRHPLGTARTINSRYCLSFPPAYEDGVFQLRDGDKVSGQIRTEKITRHIWDPENKRRELEGTEENVNLPRYPVSEYLKKWEVLMTRKDRWDDFDRQCGLYHVGYYNLLERPLLGGPFGYTDGKREVRYRELYEMFESKTEKPERALGSFQHNTRQYEIAWGNGGNAMIAYALFHYGKAWARTKAEKIINAILFFMDGGFQIQKGPLQGAWQGAFNADSNRFQDHYGGRQVFIPDQGIVNYFLGKCYLENHWRHPELIRKISRNCHDFLLPLKKRFGHFPNALSLDGSPGYSREGYSYAEANAPGIAQAALSFIILYRLDGDPRNLEIAERIITGELEPLLRKFQFGFLEYDHRGNDSSGACSILIALAEYLDIPGAGLRKLVLELQDLVFYHLLSFRMEHHYYPARHTDNMKGCGVYPVNQYAFLHGFTRGSCQGEYALHLRYEYDYALLRTWETGKQSRVRKALLNYLSNLTYMQYSDPRIAGYGGVTEHTAMKAYTQDTCHILHSVPLGMLMIASRENPDEILN